MESKYGNVLPASWAHFAIVTLTRRFCEPNPIRLTIALYTASPSRHFYAFLLFPMLVSMLPNTQIAENNANMPRVMTIGFLYPAVQG
jgi:hypothetical protein